MSLSSCKTIPPANNAPLLCVRISRSVQPTYGHRRYTALAKFTMKGSTVHDGEPSYMNRRKRLGTLSCSAQWITWGTIVTNIKGFCKSHVAQTKNCDAREESGFQRYKAFLFHDNYLIYGGALDKWLTLQFRFLSNPSERDVIWSIAARPRREQDRLQLKIVAFRNQLR